jgi:hypothetical protein
MQANPRRRTKAILPYSAPVQGTLNVFGTILALFAFLLWKYLVDLLESPGSVKKKKLLVANPRYYIFGVLLSCLSCSTRYWDRFNLAEV